MDLTSRIPSSLSGWVIFSGVHWAYWMDTGEIPYVRFALLLVGG